MCEATAAPLPPVMGFTVVGFGMGVGFKMVMLQMRKLRLSSRARRGWAEAGVGMRCGGVTKAAVWDRKLGTVCGLGGQTVRRVRMDTRRGWRVSWRGALPALHPNAPHRCIAGPWETVGFGIMGAYGLHKLNELEQWSKAKYQAEFTRKLDRNRVRARRPRSAPRQRCLQPRVAPPRDC